jgi:formate hydrogenlyase subunit 3/multisubunit Na+/H+ antiporter MnhD subunit
MNWIILLLFGVSAIIAPFYKKAGYLAILVSSAAAIVLEISTFNITSLFFIIAGIVWALASWYSLSYDNYGKWLSATFSISVFGMVLILQSNNYVEFLVGWEIMSLGGYTAIGLNSNRARPAFFFSAFSELGTVFIIAGFAYAFSISGTVDFTTLSSDIPLILTSLGFLMKMGLVPFMLSEWLPISHGSAPANSSIILSATMTLMGVFGLLKMAILSPSNLYFGMILMSIGAFGVFFGALFAYTSENTKMLPGFSTIDSNGGILVGLGLLVATVSQYERGFLISAVLLFALSHSISKTGLFMISGYSKERTFIQYSGNKNFASVVGSILVASSLSGLLPTIGGVAVWMLLESLFMQSVQFQILGVFSIIIGSLVALGEGLITGSMIKFVSFTQLLKERGNGISGLSFPVLSSGIIIVLFGIISTLLVNHSFLSGNILVGIPYGVLLTTSLNPGSVFGVISPLFVFLLVVIFSLIALGIFGYPKVRRATVWNGGVPLDSKYTSFAYSNNIRVMLKKILTPFSMEIETEDGVVNVFWDTIISIGGLYRKVARSFTYAVMNSSMTWYVAYIIAAFTLALIIGVAVY